FFVGAADVPRRPDQRLLELVPEEPDALLAREDVVAGAADVEHRASRDAEELTRLAFVGIEADVLLERQLLLAHIGDRRARRRLPGRERRHAIEVRDRPDQLVDEKAVVMELHDGHCSYSW